MHTHTYIHACIHNAALRTRTCTRPSAADRRWRSPGIPGAASSTGVHAGLAGRIRIGINAAADPKNKHSNVYKYM